MERPQGLGLRMRLAWPVALKDLNRADSPVTKAPVTLGANPPPPVEP